MTVIVVLVVINNEFADVGHVVQELDNARIESVRGGDMLVVLWVKQKRSNMHSEHRCIFQTAS